MWAERAEFLKGRSRKGKEESKENQETLGADKAGAEAVPEPEKKQIEESKKTEETDKPLELDDIKVEDDAQIDTSVKKDEPKDEKKAADDDEEGEGATEEAWTKLTEEEMTAVKDQAYDKTMEDMKK
jgi:hypothetical protein